MATSKSLYGLMFVFGVLVTNLFFLTRSTWGRTEEVSVTIKREIERALNTQRLEANLQPPPSASKTFPLVKNIPETTRRRILVTGGAGFIGSNLVDVLMMQGHYVTVMDNLFTGRRKNIEHWMGHPNFEFIRADVVDKFMIEVDQIYHLACPASPPHYQYNPIKTIKTSSQGTLNMLGLAKRVKARILFTSTSEVYGDPLEHPQKETYFGNVNTMGPRSCYDEGKRLGETLCYSFREEAGVQVRIARIFNTFGPRMHPSDGRVVSNFIVQALQRKPLTIYGDGHQTRSFQYVSDLVRGLILLMNSDYSDPVNLGNPDEFRIKDFAQKVVKLLEPESDLGPSAITYLPATRDDPQTRKPDISRALDKIKWKPEVTVDEGLAITVDYFKSEIGLHTDKTPPVMFMDPRLADTLP